MNRVQQGDIGATKAIAFYTEQGYIVSVPLTTCSRYDLIADNGEQMLRVQVKSTNQYSKEGTPIVTLSTQGGNRSWAGTIKKINSKEVDEVFVYCLNGSAWRFPVSVCADKRSLTLGYKQEPYLLV